MMKLPLSVLVIAVFLFPGCKESPSSGGDPPGSADPEEIEFDPIEETLPEGNQNPGFFLDDWQPKEITAPDFEETNKSILPLDARIQVNVENVITKVPRYVFGNNTNTYLGQMVNEPVLLNYLRDLNPHLIRFPGGNLSSIYFWDAEPGIPPVDVPELLVNGDTGQLSEAGYWYGKNEQSWTLSLDNYYAMLGQTGTTGVITVNYSYARYGKSLDPVATAAGYAADWVRYDNGRTTFWEIGNENFGTWQAGYRIDTSTNLDGQPEVISGHLYGEHIKVFVDSMKAAAAEIGADIKIGAQLIERKVTESWETDVVRNWNKGYFETAGNTADYYILHNYYTPYQQDSPPATILSSAEDVTGDMMRWMNETTSQHGVDLKPVALTEWNIFSMGSQQMVSDISGMHAAMVLGELIKHEFGMAARWNIANGWDDGNDHGMFNQGDAPGGVPKWNPRPDFFHMYFFQRFFGDRMIWSGTQGEEAVVSYASTFSSGQVGLVVANTSQSTQQFDVELKNFSVGDRYYWYVLEGADDGDFSRKVLINGTGPSGAAGGPANYKELKAYSATTASEGGVKVSAPPHSVVYMLIEGQ